MTDNVSGERRLDSALVSGIAWTAVLRWSSQILSWVATVFAARILKPADYGIVAMATIAIGLARMVEDFGLDAILVQDRSITGERQARLAGFMLAIGAGLSMIFLALAHPIAAFYDEPRVAWAVSALAVLFITDALQVVPKALLQRELEFRRLAIAGFVQVLVVQGVLVGAAVTGFGFRALVFNSIAGAVVMTLLLIYWHPFAVRWPSGIRDLARPLTQGWRVIVTRIGWYGYSNVDQAIIGRVLGKDALGAYSFATTFSTLAIQEVTSVVSKVVPGIFCDVQTNRRELKRYFLILTEFLTYLTLPMCAGFALIGDLIVDLVLGPQWQAVALPLRILSAYAAFSSCMTLISHVMMWTGQFRANMWCTILTAAVLPIGFYVGVQFGLWAVALTWAIVYPITNIPPLRIGLRTIDATFGDWFESMRPAGTACIVMAVAVVGAREVMPAHVPLWEQVAVTVGVGALVYVLVFALFFRRRVLAIVNAVKATRGQGPTAPTVQTA